MGMGVTPKNANPAMQAVNSDVSMGSASGPGGLLNEQKDAKNAATDPQFGEIMKQFETKYGAKAEKPREIKKTLGKDDFLKIMITQMKNQDPSKPFNADEMAAQMAQYASVEQLQNVNTNIQKLDSNNKTAERMQMTSMLGKVVTVDRERFPHIEGQNESLVYTLPKSASSVKISIQSESGEAILEKDLGPQKAGEQSFSWDGAKTNTIQSKNGTYVFKITAKDEKGRTLNTDPKSQARVIGVTFEGSEPIFLIGDAKNQQKVSLKNIIKIEEAPHLPSFAPASGAPIAASGADLNANGAQKGASNASASAMSGPAFFNFRKGLGSENLDPGNLSADAQAALARYQAAQAQAQGQPEASPKADNAVSSATDSAAVSSAGAKVSNAVASSGRDEKGFPNGLTDLGNN